MGVLEQRVDPNAQEGELPRTSLNPVGELIKPVGDIVERAAASSIVAPVHETNAHLKAEDEPREHKNPHDPNQNSSKTFHHASPVMQLGALTVAITRLAPRVTGYPPFAT